MRLARLSFPRAVIGALCVAILALPAGGALAAGAGDLDPSFDGDGKVILPSVAGPTDVLVQPDGKLVVPADDSFTVLRLNRDGSPDRGFGGDGAAGVDFGGGHINSAALQPDGKIVVAGSIPSFGIAVARLNANGSPDPTFDGDGKRVYSNLQPPYVGAILVQPDGRIVIVGSSNSGITASRLNPTGSPDGTEFGYAHISSHSETVHAAALAPDGAIVVAGYARTFDDPDYDAVVARFTPEGGVDKSLAATGITKIVPNDRYDKAVAVLVQPDGKIVLAGDTGSAEKRMAVTRLNENGTPDVAFGDGGMATPDFDGQDIAAGAALQPDGKILVAGTTYPVFAFAVARLDSSGALDPGFGSLGKTTITFDGIAFAQAYAAALQPDGNFVVAGRTGADNNGDARTTLARVLGKAPPSGDRPGGGSGGGSGAGAGGDGAGDPAPVRRCAGKPATIVGSARGETLRGTRGADVIVALGGNDRVIAGGGRDVVCGGAGNDRLNGGRGRDALYGGGGRDVLVGGPARDRCTGGPARDRANSCETSRTLR